MAKIKPTVQVSNRGGVLVAECVWEARWKSVNIDEPTTAHWTFKDTKKGKRLAQKLKYAIEWAGILKNAKIVKKDGKSTVKAEGYPSDNGLEARLNKLVF